MKLAQALEVLRIHATYQGPSRLTKEQTLTLALASSVATKALGGGTVRGFFTVLDTYASDEPMCAVATVGEAHQEAIRLGGSPRYYVALPYMSRTHEPSSEVTDG